MTRADAQAAIERHKTAIEDAKHQMATAGMRAAFAEGKALDEERKAFADARRDLEMAAYALGGLHAALKVIGDKERAAEHEARKQAVAALEAEREKFEVEGETPFAKRAARAAEAEWEGMIAEARSAAAKPPEAPYRDLDPCDPGSWPVTLREEAMSHARGLLIKEGLRAGTGGSMLSALAHGEEAV